MPIIFDVSATASFTNPTGGFWQRIFDFGNGAQNNNIWAGNVGNSTQMALEVWTPGGVYRLTTATGAIVAGETATWNFTISDTGVYQIFKNGALLATGTNAATIPADIDRNSNFIGQSNWGGDTPLIGTVSRIDVNTTFSNGIDLTVTNTQNDSGPLNTTDLSETVNASASTNAVTIDGAGGNDTITGGSGADRLSAGVGNDSIIGNDGADTIYGGAGNDTLDGGAANDVIRAGSGNDTVTGGAGADSLTGWSGSDVVYGGDADDTIIGDGDSGAAGTNLITNGDFSGGLTGWTANNPTGGSAPLIYSIGGANGNVAALNAQDEAVYGDSIQQTIATTQGESYDLSMFLGENGSGTGNHTVVVSVLDASGTVIASQTYTFNNATNQTISFAFTAGSASTTIRISNPTSTGSFISDLVIDNVSVIERTTAVWNDTLYGGDGNDLIYGSESISASGAADRVFGGAGNDTIFANSAATAAVGSTLDGGDGTDVITGSFAADTIAGGLGADILYGGDGADLINGDEGADLIYGGAGSDQINFGAGDNTIFGGDGDDNFDDAGGIPALFGNTLIYAGAGNDWFWDGVGNDTYFGGTGNDTLQGDNAGNDSYSGDEGNDSIAGGLGNDLLFGGADNDTVDGGAGRDFIFGGAGNDVLRGGAGADVFSAQGADTITDFDATTGVSANGNLDNDFVDLRGFYNATTLAAWNTANPGNQYDNALKWLRADQVDGILQAADGLRIQNGGVAVAGALLNNENTAVCFTAGTRLATAKGHRPIEKLRVGDLVETADHGLQPIRWIGHMTVDGMGDLAPILIAAGSLGNRRDIMVSPLHRMLVSGWRVELLFGTDEVIAAAKMLVDGAAIRPHPMREVTYYHILFDAHEIVFAEGAGAESFHPGEEGFDALGEGARAQICAVLPHVAGGDFVAYGPSARRSLRAHEARLLHMGRKMEDTGQIHTAPRKKAVAAR